VSGRGRRSGVASAVVVRRARLDELAQSPGARRADDPSSGAVPSSRVDAREVDVRVDGAERGTEGRQHDEHHQAHRQHRRAPDRPTSGFTDCPSQPGPHRSRRYNSPREV